MPPNIPPVIEMMSVSAEQAPVGQDILVSAKINDDVSVEKVELYLVNDSSKQLLKEQKGGAKSVSFSHTFKPAKAGKSWLRLYAYDATGKTLVEKDILVLEGEAPKASMAEEQAKPQEEAVKAAKEAEKPVEESVLVLEEKKPVAAKPKPKPTKVKKAAIPEEAKGEVMPPQLAEAKPVETTPASATKQPKPKIDIKKITLEGMKNGEVPSGRPLMVTVDVSASEDFKGPFAVTLALKSKGNAQLFKEGIEKLIKGLSTFKWDLTSHPEDGNYTLSVEIASDAPALKDKSSKTFRVGEKTIKVKN
jgi:hypothetical protein